MSDLSEFEELLDTPADGYGEVFKEPIDADVLRGFLKRASGTVGVVTAAKIAFIPGKAGTIKLWAERAA
ncbi:hypothetical protein BH09PSE4_BH09PSE4_22480 [soil metagenome]